MGQAAALTCLSCVLFRPNTNKTICVKSMGLLLAKKQDSEATEHTGTQKPDR